MKRYQVFDNGRPADTTGYPQLKGSGWHNSVFDTFTAAHEYALNWLGYLGDDIGAGYADNAVLKLNTPYDYSGYGDKIEIREVDIVEPIR